MDKHSYFNGKEHVPKYIYFAIFVPRVYHCNPYAPLLASAEIQFGECCLTATTLTDQELI